MAQRIKLEPYSVTGLLQTIMRAQSQFISDVATDVLFNELLDSLLVLTESEYGFIGEVFHKPDGMPYLKTHAITNIAWNEETRKFYEENAPQGLEFYNMKTLLGTVIVTGEPVISHDPYHDSRRGGLPEGHPRMDVFLGLPFHRGKNLVLSFYCCRTLGLLRNKNLTKIQCCNITFFSETLVITKECR